MADKKKKAVSTPKVKKKRVTLTLENEPGLDISLVGSFNAWEPEKKKLKEKESGQYSATLMLEPGEYEYKFVIDGKWLADPKAEAWAPNPFGSLNSVLQVSA